MLDETAEETAERHRREGTTSPGLKLPKLEAQLNRLRDAEATKSKEAEKEKKRRPIRITIGTGVATAVVGAILGFVADTRDKTDKVEQHGNEALKQAINDERDERRDEMRTLTGKVDDQAVQAGKVSEKLELLLDAAHVPQSKRPKEEP